MKKLYAALLLFSFISCSKKNKDSEAPVITLERPIGRPHLKENELVQINASVSDNVKIEKIILTKIDSAFFRLDPMFAIEKYSDIIGQPMFQYGKSFLVFPKSKTTWKYTLQAIDVNGNSAFKDFSVDIN